jgi:hypothetical protein
MSSLFLSLSLPFHSALEGASLLLTYVASESRDATEAVETIRRASPSTRVETIEVDLSTEEGCLKVVDKAKEVFDGRVDVL